MHIRAIAVGLASAALAAVALGGVAHARNPHCAGGIQYVVSNVDLVDALARERSVAVDQPLSTLGGFQLRTIWLDDPDGITNYFAETAQARAARRNE